METLWDLVKTCWVEKLPTPFLVLIASNRYPIVGRENVFQYEKVFIRPIKGLLLFTPFVIPLFLDLKETKLNKA